MSEVKRHYTVHCEGGGGIVLTGSNFNNIISTCLRINGEAIHENLVDWDPV